MPRSYLGSDLVAALAGLQVNDLTHICKGLEENEEDISDWRARELGAAVCTVKVGEMSTGYMRSFKERLAGKCCHANKFVAMLLLSNARERAVIGRAFF